MSLLASVAQLDKQEPESWSRYELARIIVHEVAHVLNRAVHGPRKHEVFYEDSCRNEAGFEFENALFGGPDWRLDLCQCSKFFIKPKAVVVSEHCPSTHVYQAYKRKPRVYTRRDQPIDYDMILRVPYAYIARMCEDSFWAEREQLSQLSAELCPFKIRPVDMARRVMEILPEGDPRARTLRTLTEVPAGPCYINCELGDAVIATADFMATAHMQIHK